MFYLLTITIAEKHAFLKNSSQLFLYRQQTSILDSYEGVKLCDLLVKSIATPQVHILNVLYIEI